LRDKVGSNRRLEVSVGPSQKQTMPNVSSEEWIAAVVG